jgi:hypothetical protein
MPSGTNYATSIDSLGNYGNMIANSILSDPDLHINFVGSCREDPHHVAVAIEARRVVDKELMDMLLKSLRSTLKRKREQSTMEAPFILIIKIGHQRLSTSLLSGLLMNRIWPNKEYSWISGVCLFTPRTLSAKINVPGSQIHDPPSSMVLLPNPGTTNSLPQELVQLFKFWGENHLKFGEKIINL